MPDVASNIVRAVDDGRGVVARGVGGGVDRGATELGAPGAGGGKAVQAVPIKPTLIAPGIQRLKL